MAEKNIKSEAERAAEGSYIAAEKERIIGEYRRLAFADPEEVKTGERLRALEQYGRALEGEEDDGELTVVVNYSYR